MKGPTRSCSTCSAPSSPAAAQHSQELSGFVGGRQYARCRLVQEAAMISAREALERLRKKGTVAFASGVRSSDMLASQTRRSEFAAKSSHSPSLSGAPVPGTRQKSSSTRAWATCSSSALPATSSPPLESGGVEFAADQFGTARGGAGEAARCGLCWPRWKSSCGRGRSSTRNLRWNHDRIRPSVEALLATRARAQTRRLSCNTPFAAMSACPQTICDTNRKSSSSESRTRRAPPRGHRVSGDRRR